MNNREIKDYLHLYLGCEVAVDGVVRKLWSVTPSGINIEDGGGTEFIRFPGFILPILRPLSDMTYDELQECGNMIYDFSDDAELNNHEWEDFKIGLAPEQFHWLLSKHFDLFGLIESGLAIDKTKSLKPAT